MKNYMAIPSEKDNVAEIDQSKIEKSVLQYSTKDVTGELAELMRETFAMERAYLGAERNIMENGVFNETADE